MVIYLILYSIKQLIIKLVKKMNTTDMPTISYKTYKISKGNGKFRIITAPNPELKSLQKKIMNDLEQFELHDSAHGFIKGRSIATNDG